MISKVKKCYICQRACKVTKHPPFIEDEREFYDIDLTCPVHGLIETRLVSVTSQEVKH